ncbi:type II toxin-antitoxin system YafQ family toxin [Carnobacterium maltaromaticum]|uniref:type II toxin-antitoxin system RelE/ParE family toxin n=1 Tax=Carnobacterium maltaromaticum TaxID=2751 RepID=UPI0039BE016C
MLTIEYTSIFKRDYKKLTKKNYNMRKLEKVVNLLLTSNQDELKIKYKDHALKGNWQGYRELHLEKNWLLIYKIDMNKFILTMIRTGTHDEIL